mmetsp:Transcript_26547/g.47033  ORF Transcript_26547/g.47033 Transcript_26547/m.47033 type:complete len:275 (+) Transcript_26547:328-1152(+)
MSCKAMAQNSLISAVMYSGPHFSTEDFFVNSSPNGTLASSSPKLMSRRETRPRPDTSFSVVSLVSTAMETPEGCRPQSARSETQTPLASSHFSSLVFSSSFLRLFEARPLSQRFAPALFPAPGSAADTSWRLFPAAEGPALPDSGSKLVRRASSALSDVFRATALTAGANPSKEGYLRVNRSFCFSSGDTISGSGCDSALSCEKSRTSSSIGMSTTSSSPSIAACRAKPRPLFGRETPGPRGTLRAKKAELQLLAITVVRAPTSTKEADLPKLR